MRLRLRYSLRVFCCVSVAIAATIGLWTRGMLQQRRYVRILSGTSIRVIYDIDAPAASGFVAARRWMAKHSGKDWVAWPVEVNAYNAPIDLESLKAIAALRSVRRVSLRSTVTDDAGLEGISRLPRLEALNLDQTYVTKRGLKQLELCMALRDLDLGYSLIEPSAVEAFKTTRPECRVSYYYNPHPETFHRQEFRTGDRTPTADEARELAAALGVLFAGDNATRYKFAEVILPPDQRRPPVDWSDPALSFSKKQHERWLTSQPPHAWDGLAIHKLGELGLAGGIPALERIARDASRREDFRTQAITALSRIADRRSVSILIELLEDASNTVAYDAWQSLKQAAGGPRGQDAEWNSDPKSEQRRNLADHWRRFWQENGDVIRVRRASGTF